MANLIGWEHNENLPKCEIKNFLGNAGNLEIESLRLLKMYDICTENYENEDNSHNKHLTACL